MKGSVCDTFEISQRILGLVKVYLNKTLDSSDKTSSCYCICPQPQRDSKLGYYWFIMSMVFSAPRLINGFFEDSVSFHKYIIPMDIISGLNWHFTLQLV